MDKKKQIKIKIKKHISCIKQWQKEINRAEDRIKVLSDEMNKIDNLAIMEVN